jgi:hypothetical protein
MVFMMGVFCAVICVGVFVIENCFGGRLGIGGYLFCFKMSDILM